MNIPRKQLDAWMNALRSGSYAQTTRVLQNGDGFCCLGVACDVLIPKRKLARGPSGNLRGHAPISQEHAPEYLKHLSADFFSRTGTCLVELNDTDCLTFDEIADLLYAVYVLRVMDEEVA